MRLCNVGLTASRAAPGSTQAGRLQLVGYASVFGTETVIANLFREVVDAHAFDEAIQRDDVRALLNHDPSQLLGRTKAGDLRLAVDAYGLRYEIDIDPEDELAMRVYRWVQKKKITQSSFGFKVDLDDVRHDPTGGSLPLRTIRKVTLYDISPVTFPAYSTTSVSANDLARASAPTATASGATSSGAQYLQLAQAKLAEAEADCRRDAALAISRRRPTQGPQEAEALLRLPSDRRPVPVTGAARRRLDPRRRLR